jgi:ABC-type polysaccharide/polyol phosphate export permease
MQSISELRKRLYLIRQYLKRQIALRYKSTGLGIASSLVNLLFMLEVGTDLIRISPAKITFFCMAFLGLTEEANFDQSVFRTELDCLDGAFLGW